MENDQAKNNFLIKVGVATTMSLIFIFWLFNIKNVFISSADENNESAQEIVDLKKDFVKTINQVENTLTKVEKTNNNLLNASSSLINELIIETNKAASSSESGESGVSNATDSPVVSTSSLPIIPLISSSTKKNKFDCPAYIDCMPTIEPARSKPCQVPVGCEGITQIAY